MKLSIQERLILIFTFAGLVIIVGLGMLSYFSAREAILQRTFDQLQSVRNARKIQVEQYFKERIAELEMLSMSNEIGVLFSELYDNGKKNNSNTVSKNQFSKSFLFASLFSSRESEKLILSDSGKSFMRLDPVNSMNVSTIEYQETEIINEAIHKCKSIDEAVITDYLMPVGGDKKVICIFAPLKNKEGHSYGIVGLELSHLELNRILLEQNDQNGLGYSGEVYLIGPDKIMRSQSRFVKQSIGFVQVQSEPANSVFKSGEGERLAIDYRGVDVLSSYACLNIPGLNWAIIAEIDYKEALQPIQLLRNNLLFISMGFLILLLATSVFLSRFLLRSIKRLKNAVGEVSMGNFQIQIPAGNNDELDELATSFNDMTMRLDRQKSELEIREKMLEAERQKQITSFIDGQEEERKRLSRDLHDGIGQTLAAVKLRLEGLSARSAIDLPDEHKEIKALVDLSINDVRRMSDNLMPVLLQQFGLSSALRHLCDSTGLEVVFSQSGSAKSVEESRATCLFRIAQESISNAMKHAHAKEIQVNLTYNEKGIKLLISDNGIGFDPDVRNKDKGHGLFNISERVRIFNGQFTLQTRVGQGTTIEIFIPYHD